MSKNLISKWCRFRSAVKMAYHAVDFIRWRTFQGRDCSASLPFAKQHSWVTIVKERSLITSRFFSQLSLNSTWEFLSSPSASSLSSSFSLCRQISRHRVSVWKTFKNVLNTPRMGSLLMCETSGDRLKTPENKFKERVFLVQSFTKHMRKCCPWNLNFR